MERRRNSCPLDACEKFFKAITVGSFRKIRRVSHHHQGSKPAANPAPYLSPQSSIPIVKTLHSAKHPKPVESAHLHKTPKNMEAAEVVPIEFDYSVLPSATVQKNGQVPSVAPRKEPLSQLVQVKKVAARHKSEPAHKYKHMADNTLPRQAVGYGHQEAQVSRMESNKLGANMEDKFTDYINRAGTKIRTTSSVGEKNNSSSALGEDDGKDHFSDYINLAKNKMLRTMSTFAGGRSDSIK